MKKIGMSLMALLFLGMGNPLQAQEEVIKKYHEVMSDFLSHDCLSFNMTNTQYANFTEEQILENMEYDVIKQEEVWHLVSGDYEILFTEDYLVTIDNASQIIHLEKGNGLSPAQIFSNPSGIEQVMDYLSLNGAVLDLGNGAKAIEFKAPQENKTTIKLEFLEEGSIVQKASADIDMTFYDDIDHPFDGMRIESIYRDVSTDVCQFDSKISDIINSQFAVLQNTRSFQGYLVN